MARIDEIAPDLYRVSVYLPQIDLQFNHFPDQRRRAAAVPYPDAPDLSGGPGRGGPA